MLHGHGFWCHAMMSGYDAIICSQDMMSVYGVWAYCQYIVIVLYHCIMSVYGVRYHASICCQSFMPVYDVTIMSRHHASANVLMKVFAVNALCHCMLSELDVTVYWPRAWCHCTVRLCLCMLSGHHIILFYQNMISGHHTTLCCQSTMPVYAVSAPCQQMLLVHHASAYCQGMITVCWCTVI